MLNRDAVQTQTPNRSANVLYLSYDGMCDPLGGSQVLPYLFGLRERGHSVTLISFEKPGRTREEIEAIDRECTAAGIDWHALPYHKRPPVLSSIYDLAKMRRLAERLHRDRGFDLVHCRSYLPALVGLRLKRRHGLPLVFDMRGFWADERVDGRIWNLRNPIYRAIYGYFKRQERDFWTEADEIVSLTHAGERVLRTATHHGQVRAPVTVIPCCVDFDAFPAADSNGRSAARKLLGIPPQAKVAAYLGSFGSWYLIDQMMDFFRVQLQRDPAAVFLVVTREPRDQIVKLAQARGVPSDRVIVRPASRAEVPKILAAADYGLFFIKPAFSKKASSPTKLGEFLALELPMVTNGDVGDVEEIIRDTGAGVIVGGFDELSYGRAIEDLEDLRPDMNRWRTSARRWFDLEMGIERYNEIYRRILLRTTEQDLGA